ncbi:hypothetical protein CDAR_409601 [Caerostris darwini]|uniref:Uncharacterized protein n=1 Tax=Caerostris darwini TaxID=1538125 RepID=A0AAV4S815_9ARAC|nr:hypothetical protein CDAR_409601 [Caerostris darwini]
MSRKDQQNYDLFLGWNRRFHVASALWIIRPSPKMCGKFVLLFVFVAVISALIGVGKADQLHRPQPYSFGYAIEDAHGSQHRQEEGDGAGVVRGSYGFVDERGIHRIVYYVADHLGFRAKIVTNEPGTANQNPAGVLMQSVV